MGWTEDEIARRMSDLPERFADRISPDSLRSIRRTRDAGEPLSTVLALIRSLHRHRAEISGRERAELQDYLTRRDTPDESDQIPDLLSVAGALLAEIPLTEGLPEERIEATARSLRPMFEHLIPEHDRWELAEAEDREDWPDLVFATVELLERHRIPVRRDEREILRLLLDALDLPRTGLAEIPSDPPGDATDQATDAAVDRAIAEIRELVLRWFGADPADPPAANELEALLQAAVDGMDFDAYAAALTDAELVVPVDGTDWLIVTDAQTRVVAAFTSAELLDTVAPGNRPRRRVPMATLAAEWPAPDVVLCLNPGARTELVLLPEELTTFITGR